MAELDDSDPARPAFETVDPAVAGTIADSFRRTGCLVECDGRRYRPYRVALIRPGWWRVDMLLVNVPLDK